jgi:hypothetical protein
MSIKGALSAASVWSGRCRAAAAARNSPRNGISFLTEGNEGNEGFFYSGKIESLFPLLSSV